jgi:hypothetical protein
VFPNTETLPIGSSVGWLGFPAIARDTLCFFAGTISAAQRHLNAYLIDGVAINGVSGGPVLRLDQKTSTMNIVGVITAYHANRAFGESLPGLSVAQDVSHFHGVIQHVKSLDDAERKKREFDKMMQSILAPPPNQPQA